MIPRDHPRYHSLMQREKLARGYEQGVVVLEGLIAHGRGEAFDYLLGETTIEPARRAIRAAAASLLLASSPVISVNGNTAALCAKELVRLAKEAGAKLEVNLFYRSTERARRIAELLRRAGAEEVLGVEPEAEIPSLSSQRRLVARQGIYSADVVLLAIEDGDRTEALVDMGKRVIAIDLNPLSRTARRASITIVDEVTRALPLLTRELARLRGLGRPELKRRASFDNSANLREVLSYIARRLEEFRPEDF
ncbi:MAG: phosphopantothenate/pantothenate synthetase [Euryarchaeota archaeon]|nr:phosphopantothenate/pantothenate synthetase [Euryarchaeota archaeon]